MAGKQRDGVKVTTGEFAISLAESGLFEAGDLLPDSVPKDAADGAEAARELVAAGKLTDFQADAVLGRRFNELRIGNYEILDRLGAGGMGTVYKARHRRMKRVVALKVLSKEVAGKFADRFQREVETIARLHHPNIVMAFDADECEAGPFLVMEFVNGRDLAWEVAQAGPLSTADAIDRILQAARGLEYAHSQGIVHRDIKPGNILRDNDGVVKVADLGLARLNAPDGQRGNTSLTEAGMVVGTVDYMPPEQAMGMKVDHRADIYSLGCTLYFLLTGRPPYQGETILAVMLKHRDDPIPNVCETRPDVSLELGAVFRRMVAKESADRFQSMAEVVRALEQLLTRSRRTAAPADAAGAPATARLNTKTVEVTASEIAAGARDTGAFELSLPTTPESTPAATKREARPTVVLVETSRTQAEIIRRYLQQLGMTNVHLTNSGRAALDLAKQVGAGVIISSMHLTDMTGIDLALAVLADPACAGVGFVLATSATDTHESGEIPSHPRVVMMPKPFDPQRLATSIAAVTG